MVDVFVVVGKINGLGNNWNEQKNYEYTQAHAHKSN